MCNKAKGELTIYLLVCHVFILATETKGLLSKTAILAMGKSIVSPSMHNTGMLIETLFHPKVVKIN